LFILKMLVVNYINQTSEVKRDGRRDPECKIAARQTKSVTNFPIHLHTSIVDSYNVNL